MKHLLLAAIGLHLRGTWEGRYDRKYSPASREEQQVRHASWSHMTFAFSKTQWPPLISTDGCLWTLYSVWLDKTTSSRDYALKYSQIERAPWGLGRHAVLSPAVRIQHHNTQEEPSLTRRSGWFVLLNPLDRILYTLDTYRGSPGVFQMIWPRLRPVCSVVESEWRRNGSAFGAI